MEEVPLDFIREQFGKPRSAREAIHYLGSLEAMGFRDQLPDVRAELREHFARDLDAIARIEDWFLKDLRAQKGWEGLRGELAEDKAGRAWALVLRILDDRGSSELSDITPATPMAARAAAILLLRCKDFEGCFRAASCIDLDQVRLRYQALAKSALREDEEAAQLFAESSAWGRPDGESLSAWIASLARQGRYGEALDLGTKYCGKDGPVDLLYCIAGRLGDLEAMRRFVKLHGADGLADLRTANYLRKADRLAEANRLCARGRWKGSAEGSLLRDAVAAELWLLGKSACRPELGAMSRRSMILYGADLSRDEICDASYSKAYLAFRDKAAKVSSICLLVVIVICDILIPLFH